MRDTDTDVQAPRCGAGETRFQNNSLSLCAGALLLLSLAALVGCEQQTAAVTAQPVRNTNDAPATNTTGAGGYTVNNFNFWQGSPGAEPADPANGIAALTAEDEGDADVTAAASSEAGGNTGKAKGRNIIAGNTWVIHTGGNSTPSTAAPTYSGSGSQQASQDVKPEQKPEASVQAPVTVATTGGAAAGQATGATGQGTASGNQDAQLDALWQQVRAGGPNAAAALEQIRQILGLRAASQPAP